MTNSSTRCSFCSKSGAEVFRLISGINAYICDECIDTCSSIIHTEKTSSSLNTNFTPKKIKEFLDEYVIGQESAKITIAVAVASHYKRINNKSNVKLDKNNLLIVGPSGSGKTHFAKAIAKLLDVPFTIADATSITEAGYVGDDVESVISRLLQAAGGDVKKAQRGIVYIDEIDKKTKKTDGSSVTRDVSGEGVQQALLKVIEGSEIRVPISGNKKSGNQEMVTIDTSTIMFIVGGAFVGIDSIIENRNGKNSIGFGFSQIADKKTNKDITTDDLIKFGLIPELVGRLNIITKLEELSVEDLTNILTVPKDAIIKQYQVLFETDGVALIFDHDAVKAIAKIAHLQKIGARGLRSVIEHKLKNIQYELPELAEQGVTSIIINQDFIVNNGKPLYIFKQNENTP